MEALATAGRIEKRGPGRWRKTTCRCRKSPEFLEIETRQGVSGNVGAAGVVAGEENKALETGGTNE